MAWRLNPTVGLWGAMVGGLALLLGLVAVLNPLIALLAAFGLVFIWFSFNDLAIGVCLFALAGSLESLPGLGELSFAKMAGGIILLSWLALVSTHDDRERGQLWTRHPALGAACLLFVVWGAASALWAEDSGEALYVTLRYALSLCLLPIIFTAVRQRAHVIALVSLLTLGTLFSAGYGAFISAGDLDAAAEGRLSGADTDSNYLATALVACLVFAGAIAASRQNKPALRFYALVAAGLCALAMAATVSRTGIFALGAVIVSGLFLCGAHRRLALAGASAVLVATVVLYFAALAPDAASRRITNLEGGGSGRTDIWTVGWRMVEDEPLHGVGTGNFPISSIHYLVEPGSIIRDEFVVDTPKVAHNIYLEVLAEMGVVGLLLFSIILVASVSAALRAARRFAEQDDRALELLARATAIAAIGILVASAFQSQQFQKTFWIVMGLGPAMLALSHSQTRGGSWTTR
jgi:O-antigen ligase